MRLGQLSKSEMDIIWVKRVETSLREVRKCTTHAEEKIRGILYEGAGFSSWDDCVKAKSVAAELTPETFQELIARCIRVAEDLIENLGTSETPVHPYKRFNGEEYNPYE